jgi:hypothetical protein
LPFQPPIAQLLQINLGLKVWVAFKLSLSRLPQTQRVPLEAVTHGAPTQVPRQRLKCPTQTANASQRVGQWADLGDAGLHLPMFTTITGTQWCDQGRLGSKVVDARQKRHTAAKSIRSNTLGSAWRSCAVPFDDCSHGLIFFAGGAAAIWKLLEWRNSRAQQRMVFYRRIWKCHFHPSAPPRAKGIESTHNNRTGTCIYCCARW